MELFKVSAIPVSIQLPLNHSSFPISQIIITAISVLSFPSFHVSSDGRCHAIIFFVFIFKLWLSVFHDEVVYDLPPKTWGPLPGRASTKIRNHDIAACTATPLLCKQCYSLYNCATTAKTLKKCLPGHKTTSGSAFRECIDLRNPHHDHIASLTCGRREKKLLQMVVLISHFRF